MKNKYESLNNIVLVNDTEDEEGNRQAICVTGGEHQPTAGLIFDTGCKNAELIAQLLNDSESLSTFRAQVEAWRDEAKTAELLAIQSGRMIGAQKESHKKAGEQEALTRVLNLIDGKVTG